MADSVDLLASAVKKNLAGAPRARAGGRIRVTAIASGFFLGKQNGALLVDVAAGLLTQRRRDIISRMPLARFVDPEDLAGVVVFLASNAALGSVTGTSIPVDDGFLVDCI